MFLIWFFQNKNQNPNSKIGKSHIYEFVVLILICEKLTIPYV